MSTNQTPTGGSLPSPRRAPAGDGNSVSIPYSSIIKLIPQELWGKLAPSGVAGYHFDIARMSVLEQLPQGSVKVSFGDLRRSAPSGVFVNNASSDTRLIDLPMHEILESLHPDSYSRRPDQRPVVISQDVPDLFGAKGERLAPLRVMGKKEASNTSSLNRQNQVVSGGTSHTAPPYGGPSQSHYAAPAAPAHAPVQHAQPPPPVAPTGIPLPPTPQIPAAPQVPQAIRMSPTPPVASPPPASQPAYQPAAPLPPHQVPPTQPMAPHVGSVPPLPSAPPGLTAPSAAAFLISLDVLAENWPDSIRKELAQLKIPNAKVGLPSVEVCDGLKRGRLQYPWRAVRSWIQPTPVYAAPSPNDAVMLEMPLRTVTPLFLDFIRANPVNRQAADAENITEFFRKAERSTGTSPDLMQPLFQPMPGSPGAQQGTPTAPTPPVAPTSQIPTPQVQAPPLAPTGLPTPSAPSAPQPPAAPVAPPVAPQFTPPAAPAPAPLPPVGLPLPGAVAPAAQPPQTPAPAATPAAAPSPAAAPAPGQPCVEGDNFCLPVGMVSDGWPDAVSRDVEQFGLKNSRLEIPLSLVDKGLKAGRLEFSWRDLCTWINPASEPAQTSINGELLVNLPLHLVAPVFLSRPNAGGSRKKVSVADDIPDLFSAAGVPNEAATAAPAEVAPQPAPEPAPEPAPVAAAPEAQPAPKKVPTNLSELFGVPDKKTWTPNEIVQRTTGLSGVEGAIIALQDGLLVAFNMPQVFKTDTIAAFVPQIFGRMNQYSKDLKLGETTAVSFTVDIGTFQVYKAGIIYFAAMGKPDSVLPLAELQLIAGELSRHTK